MGTGEVGSSIRKAFVDRGVGEFDEETGQSLNEDFHEAASLVGPGGMGVAGAAVRGQEVPGTGDGNPAAVDGVEPGFGLDAVVADEVPLVVAEDEFGAVSADVEGQARGTIPAIGWLNWIAAFGCFSYHIGLVYLGDAEIRPHDSSGDGRLRRG